MSSRLKQIQNWPARAQKAEWKVGNLAQLCGVSVRTLERYFREHMGAAPAKWLLEDRQKKGAELIRDGLTIKEAASATGYKHANNFSRAVKFHTGSSPTLNVFAD